MAQYSITNTAQRYSTVSLSDGVAVRQYWAIPKTAKINIDKGLLYIYVGEQLVITIPRKDIAIPSTETDAELFSALSFMTDAGNVGSAYQNGVYESGGIVRFGGELNADTELSGGTISGAPFALSFTGLRAFSVSSTTDTTFQAGSAIRLLSDIVQLSASAFVYWGDESTDGSFRQGVVGGNIVLQERISGVWTTIGNAQNGFGFNVVVGISTAGDTAQNCDYLDTGDGVQLQAAISSIPSGGTVLVRYGDITLQSALSVSNTGIRVLGSNTILRTKTEGLRRALNMTGQYSSFEGFRIIISEIATSPTGTEIINIAANYTRFQRNYISYKYATSDSITAMIRVATNVNTTFVESNILESSTMLYTQKGIDIMSLCQNIKADNTFNISGVAYYIDNATNCNLIGQGISDRAAHLSSCTRVNVAFVGNASTAQAALSAPYNYGVYLSACVACKVKELLLNNSGANGIGIGLVNSTEIVVSDALLQNFLSPLTADITSYTKLTATLALGGNKYEYLSKSITLIDSEVEYTEMKFKVQVNTNANALVFQIACALNNQYQVTFLYNYKRTGLAGSGWIRAEGGVCRDGTGTTLTNNSMAVTQQDSISGNNPIMSHAVVGSNYNVSVNNGTTTATILLGTVKILRTAIPATF